MKTIGIHNYYVYILTNRQKTVLYIGITNDLGRRLEEHKQNALITKDHFTGKYNVINLVFWEHHTMAKNAILREKQLKGWSRQKKIALISDFNPQWVFLNDDF